MPVKKALELLRPLTIAEADGNFNYLHSSPSTLIISSGIITVDGTGWYIIDTEGAAATDSLTRINGTAIGDLVELRSAAAGRVITVQHGAFLKMENDQDKILNSIYDAIVFRSYGGDILVERGRFNSPGL